MKTISICIPTYEMNGKGVEYLAHSFNILQKQTFKDFDIVISDHSINDDIKNLCSIYSASMSVNYFRNSDDRGSSSSNINNAIANATGKLIKILFQDDFLYNEHSLQQIVTAFNIERDNWLIAACEHTTDGTTLTRAFYPKYNSKIYLGNNTISSPSVLTIKRSTALLFDNTLIWLMDVDYYKRCFEAFGEPLILNTITVVNRIGVHQVSNTIATRRLKMREYLVILKKYEKGLSFWYYRLIGFTRCLLK